MLIYAAIGDAYGAAWEFLPHNIWKNPNDGQNYFRNPVTKLGDGKYTDDAQTSAAVMTALLDYETRKHRAPRVPFEDYYHSFYNRDPRPGYSTGFSNLLESTANGTELRNTLIPSSSRSGAVMNAAPLGALKNLSRVLALTADKTAITHNTPIAVEAARAVALAAHYLIHVKQPREKLGNYLNNVLDSTGSRTVDWTEDRTDWASIEAVDCARNAITAWRNSHTLTEVLVNSVAPGGDTDTVASIAMSLAWADQTIQDDLNPRLIAELEHGDFGFPFLFDINHRFVEAFTK